MASAVVATRPGGDGLDVAAQLGCITAGVPDFRVARRLHHIP